jgi:outer membrane PBP1 activator LpoA protein
MQDNKQCPLRPAQQQAPTEMKMTTANSQIPLSSACNPIFDYRSYFQRAISLATILTVLLTAACTPMQTGQQGESAGNAQLMSEKGDHVAASREYLNLALQTAGDQRQRYLIFAAGELYLANDLDGTEKILDRLGDDIAEANLAIWAEVTALLKRARNDPEGALAALNQVTSTDNKDSAARILLLRGESLFQLNRPESAVATLLKREELLTRRAAIEANRTLIWSGLQSSGAAIQPDAITNAKDPVLAGWLQIGYLAYTNRSSLSNLTNNLEEWQLQNPQHPATGKLLDDVLASMGALSSYPNRVALLLPISGKQQALGEAIRDGFLAAHFALGDDTHRPDIFVYDTARNGAANAYQQATLNGAGFIVGPLLKDEIAEIAEISDGTTILALNYAPAEQKMPAGFYQFALAPEDEARAAADRASDKGMHNAVALVPDNNWGKRVLEAFREQLEKRGGKLLAAQLYPTNTPDFSQSIREILLLDESYARRDRLAANIGKTLEFEPRRRQDVDLIFLGANTAAAKLLNPQLRFHYAGELPTFATSAIYQPGSTNNSDLNGILFPDIPWLLDPNQSVKESQLALENYWGVGAKTRSRFYAMGYDAYYLVGMLNGRSDRSRFTVNGTTGLLFMDDNGQLHRKLRWARMERGKPRVLPEVSSSLTENAEIVISQQ